MAAPQKTLALANAGSPYVTEDLVEAGKHLEALISRFDSRRRRAIRRLLNSSTRVADLASAFPGLFYALATRQSTPARREKALALIEAGAPLKTVAQTVDLPLWLRRLGPEAFSGPIGSVPKSDVFSRRIANHLPRKHEDSAFWLKSVTFASNACDDYFAIWLAQQSVFSEPGDPKDLFGVLAAWAWYSTHSHTRQSGRSLIVTPWRPEMCLDTAICSAKSWLNRVRLVLELHGKTEIDPWLAGGDAGGLTFAPLLTYEQVLVEARTMHNCADQYADRLVRDKCRLFSVSRRGLKVATLEVAPHPREIGVLTISQLKCRHNMPASAEIWKAAHMWMGSQRSVKRSPSVDAPERSLDEDAWTKIVKPYRRHKGGADGLPANITVPCLQSLDDNINELARRAGITSWLFT